MRRVAFRGIGKRALAFLGVGLRAAARAGAAVAAGDERIGQHTHEQVHRVERRLLRTGRQLAGGLRQA